MLTKIKKMFVLVMFAAFVFALTGCGGGLKGALDDLSIDAEVTEGFALPTVALEGAVTTWTSNNDAIVIDETYADVIRPSLSDVEVTLTATVTQGEKTESKDFVVVVKCLLAPDAININVGGLKAVEGKTDTYYLVAGKEAQFEIEVADEEMSKEVTWTVSNSRATVSADGLVKGVKYGEVKITATSTSAGAGGVAITDSVTLEVVEHENPLQVLLANKKAIEAQIPRFISSTYEFPMAPNEEVDTLYFDATSDRTNDENAFYYGEYAYVEGPDRQETIYCVLRYKGEVVEFEFVISVVTNEEDNEFLALDYAQAELDKVFGQYIGGQNKVSADMEVPAAFTADEAMYDVEISYDSVTDYTPTPIDVNSVDGKLVAQYTKPNDDSIVRIEAYFKTANVDRVVRYNLTAAGYTQEEIVEYLTANVLPQPAADGSYSLVCAHMTLPTGDTTGKFGKLEIEWASSKEEVLSSAGRFANPNLAAPEVVTLTATIKYAGTVGAQFAFETTKAIEVEVKPAENKAQAVALQVSNYVSAPEFMEKISYFPFGKKDRLDADGNITNVMPLPKKVSELTSEMAEYADLEIKWSATEEGLLDENYKLLKQYLRYHEVALTYSVTVDGNTATNEVVINVGITQVKNTIYIGGNYYQQTGGGDVAGDVLCQLSKFDSPVGVLPGAAKTWGYSYSQGQFNGLTWYIDKTDENGVTTRYQYFAAVNGFITLDDQYKIELANPEDKTSVVITLNEEINKLIGTNYGGNWACIYHNISDKEVKIPLSPYTGGPSPFKDAEGVEIKWENHPWKKANKIDRENAFGLDGYRAGFVADKDGNIVLGNGENYFQAAYDVNSDGQMTEDDFWVTIPAGGYAYTSRTQQNNLTIMGKFCEVGVQLNMEMFDPYFSSPDGSSEGLGSFKHE